MPASSFAPKMPSTITSAGSAVACMPWARPWMMFVAWPVSDAFAVDRRPRGPARAGVDRHLLLRPDRPRRHRRAVRNHGLLHVDALLACAVYGEGVGDRPRNEDHPGPRPG